MTDVREYRVTFPEDRTCDVYAINADMARVVAMKAIGRKDVIECREIKHGALFFE